MSENKDTENKEDEERYDLKGSKRIVGELYAVLKDAHGNIIDGLHRKDRDPNWREEIRDNIKTPVQFWLARIAANAHRRIVSREERAEQFTHLAEELVKEGVINEDIINTIAKLTTFSDRYVRELLPDKYKPRLGIGGHPVELSSTPNGTSKSQITETPSIPLTPIGEEEKYLTDRFAAHPLLMTKDDEFETYKFAEKFKFTMEEASKKIRDFRNERRKSQSSEQIEIERPPRIETKIPEEEDKIKQTYSGDAWHPEKLGEKPPPLPSKDNSPEAILDRAAEHYGIQDDYLLYVLQEEGNLSLEDAKEKLSNWKLSRPKAEIKKEIAPGSGFTPKPKVEEEDSVTKLSKYYPYEIIDEVLKRLPNSTFETLLKYCRSFVSTLYSKAPLDLRQAVLEEFIR